MTTALSRLVRSHALTLVPVLVLLSTLTIARPAAAQLARASDITNAIGIGVLGTDVGYDPINGQYLFVGGAGYILGVCTNTAGAPVAPFFNIMDGAGNYGHYPRVKYSPDAPNGAGGLGAFLVVWHQQVAPNVNGVFAALVSCASATHVVAGPQLISDPSIGTLYTMGAAIAYSRTSRRFLVVYPVGNYSVSARFVDTNGTPFGGYIPITNPGTSHNPGVAWNPGTDEFGVSYAGFGGAGAYAGFVRVRPSDGSLWGRTTFGFTAGTYNTDISVNPANNTYVVGWALSSGSNFSAFDSAGNQTLIGLLSPSLGGSTSFSIDHNGTSGTFLAVGQDPGSYEVTGVELNSSGFPITSATVLTSFSVSPGSFYPRVGSRQGAAQWGVSYSRAFRSTISQIVGTSSVNGGPAGPAPAPAPAPTPAPAPPANNGGCAGSDPFAMLGGGHCENGGWRMGPAPGNQPAPAPAPAPTPAPAPNNSGCAGNDPFAALGGGHCENGGWRMGPAPNTPAPVPTAPSTPAPTPVNNAGCAGSDPFAALGGGHCENGGWRMGPGSNPAPAPAPAPPANNGGCAGNDPFATIGGGVCVNGGWQMQNMSCGTPDPFSAIGGGICTNGGWRPRGLPVPEQQEEPRW